jgi:membrane dipeptidase
MKIRCAAVVVASVLAVLPLCSSAAAQTDTVADRDRRAARIHASHVFADIHAHPSRFHRWNVERIDSDEIALYRRGLIDVVVANISTDAALQGGYIARDGSRTARLSGNDVYPLDPGAAFAFTLDRLDRVLATVAAGDAVLASSPAAALEAKRRGQLALLPALEGADGLEGSLDNLRELHRRGVRLVQLMHFVDNDIGSNQTPPKRDSGLTDFGRALVREANRLGIVVDLAHANTQTILDALDVSSQPILFSHTGVKARYDGDRYITDEEIRAIAAKGGVIGIWPAAALQTIEEMVQHIDHVKRVLHSIPFFGPVRISLLMATMKTPWRFRTKRNLWAYAGLAVVTETSAEYAYVHGRPVRRRRKPLTRGLNKNYNRVLKNVLKGAAAAALGRPGPFQDMYDGMVRGGMREDMARLTLARKFAAVALRLWKRGERFDPKLLTAQST